MLELKYEKLELIIADSDKKEVSFNTENKNILLD